MTAPIAPFAFFSYQGRISHVSHEGALAVGFSSSEEMIGKPVDEIIESLRTLGFEVSHEQMMAGLTRNSHNESATPATPATTVGDGVGCGEDEGNSTQEKEVAPPEPSSNKPRGERTPRADDFFADTAFVATKKVRLPAPRRTNSIMNSITVSNAFVDNSVASQFITGVLVGTVLSDEYGVIVMTNPAANTMFGYDAGELLGQSVNVLMTKQQAEHHDTYLQRIREHAPPRVIGTAGREVIAVHSSGLTFPVRLMLSRGTGNITKSGKYFMAVFEDLREVRLLEQTRKEALEKSLRAERSKEVVRHLLWFTSHDMSLPVQSTAVAARKLLERTDPNDFVSRELLHVLMASMEVLSVGLANIIDVQKIESGNLKVKEAPCNISEVVHRALNVLPFSSVDTTHVRVIRNIETGEDVIVDGNMLKRVVINLVTNSFKFTKEGTITVTVQSVSDNTKEIIVSDTGVGMDPETLSKATNTAIESNRLRGGGNGLGLFISCALIKAMGGSLKVESALGLGTTCKIIINAPKADTSHLKRDASFSENPCASKHNEGSLFGSFPDPVNIISPRIDKGKRPLSLRLASDEESALVPPTAAKSAPAAVFTVDLESNHRMHVGAMLSDDDVGVTITTRNEDGSINNNDYKCSSSSNNNNNNSSDQDNNDNNNDGHSQDYDNDKPRCVLVPIPSQQGSPHNSFSSSSPRDSNFLDAHSPRISCAASSATASPRVSSSVPASPSNSMSMSPMASPLGKQALIKLEDVDWVRQDSGLTSLSGSASMADLTVHDNNSGNAPPAPPSAQHQQTSAPSSPVPGTTNANGSIQHSSSALSLFSSLTLPPLPQDSQVEIVHPQVTTSTTTTTSTATTSTTITTTTTTTTHEKPKISLGENDVMDPKQLVPSPSTGDVESFDRLNVLVAEDVYINREMLKRVITKLQHNVATAENGKIALDMMCAPNNFHIVLMDINMPVMNGDEAVERYREWEAANHPGKRLQIVALTGNVEEEDRERCISKGCDNFIPKPITMLQLQSLFSGVKLALQEQVSPTQQQQQLQLHLRYSQTTH